MTDAMIPRATYRLQFNKNFTFRDATALVPYLDALGVSDAYASPFLKARPGSSHGYDITDHRQFNPEIGSEDDFNVWAAALAERSIGILLDIVPNHMAVAGNENLWWNDVLENGPSSPYSGYFDIAWTAATRPELHGRVLIPILGDPYAKALEAQQLSLAFEGGAFAIRYFEHRFPVAPRSYGLILGNRLAELEARLPATDPAFLEYQSVLTALKHLPPSTETDPALIAEQQREKEVVKRRLAALANDCPSIREFIDDNVTQFNGLAGDAASFNLLERLLDDQVYRLAFWRVAAEEINYRRFFDVNELAALSMERPDVFAATHELLVRLTREGKVHGVRIDHPDGLFDPREYLNRLRDAVGADAAKPLYVLVEKILAADEALPPDWPTAGTTGYDFLNLVNGLFVDPNNAAAFSRIYAEWIGDETSFAELTYQKKILILQIALAGEMQMLTHQLDRLAQRHRSSRDFTRNSLRIGLREIIACFPVYRSYIAGDVSDADRRHVLRAVRRATLRNPALNTSIFLFIRDTLLLRLPGSGPIDADYAQEQRRFVGKFQQVTSPVMAKGAEDTAAYIFNRLISLNEVGGDPDRFGTPVAEFHEAMRRRQATTPGALSATSTHDTKRGEDVRTRIDVLSELPDEWRTRLVRWNRLNEQHRSSVDDISVPDRNEEYFLYQTMLGAWPDDAAAREGFTPRLQAYMAKALHEAKVHTSWINPNQPYDEAMSRFIASILDPARSGAFLNDFAEFHGRLRDFGMMNSLAQTIIKIAAPGVPDFYQGTELWDLNLVDPDNRRPVDFSLRQRWLAQPAPTIRDLVDRREDGHLKLFVAQRTLALRRDRAEIFAAGEYVPLEVSGPMRDHIVSFARVRDDVAAVVVVPRLLAGIVPASVSPFAGRCWEGTTLALDRLPRLWRNIFTEEALEATDSSLSVAELLGNLPVSVLISANPSGQ
jgi:(1->4)-alpha-D-glucan 1-alpha-D-glucosylmutase